MSVDSNDIIKYPNFWVEKTIIRNRPDRQYGEYALGQALWSPQKSKKGADIYHFMREVQTADIVLHLVDNSAFTGLSRVKSPVEEFQGLDATQWGKQPSYLVRLQNFRYLNPPLTRGDFFSSPYKEKLINLLDSGKNLFYNREISLNQGAYLTPAPKELIEILNESYKSISKESLYDVIDEILIDSKYHINIPSNFTTSSASLDTFNSLDMSDSIEVTEGKSFDQIKKLSEKELLDHIELYLRAKGYYFDKETIYNYHICLKTRPFVLLAGLSGTGKSKLSQLYAEAIGHSLDNKRYLRLPVRPNWNDDRYILGYFDFISREYITEPALDFIIRASEDRNNLYILCLDEMNLALVEYYFSQFLSALEEDEPDYRTISLFGETIQSHMAAKNDLKKITPYIKIPTNLFIAGTINVDETTQSLSDKVLDRANTIEFFEVDLDKIPKRTQVPKPILVTIADWYSHKALEADDSYRSQIIEIAKILNKANLGIGYRIVRDIEQYLANSKNLLDSEIAFDLQIKQRVLPHIRGTRAIEEHLKELLNFLEAKNLSRSAKRLSEMSVRLNRDGYVNFWR